MEKEQMGINLDSKPSGEGCAECLATDGGWWLHLRRCAECGHIGCCDSSPSQHASKHAHSAGHPVATSFEPGEHWFFDYEKQKQVEGAKLLPPHSHPAGQPAPGPAEKSPKIGSLCCTDVMRHAKDEIMTINEEAVAAVLAAYQDALNASDTDAVMPLYAEDGVFMPPYSPSAIGTAAVRAAYDAVFQAITLRVKFTVAEVVEMAPGWVFARTNSAGTVTDHAIGAESAEGNQELFLFKKSSGGDWQIARYSFSSTHPAPSGAGASQ